MPEDGGLHTAQPPAPTGGYRDALANFLSTTETPIRGVFEVSVEAGTLHAITAGPLCIMGVCKPGGRYGESRGTVVIFLPRASAYRVSGLDPGPFWHGAYYGADDLWRDLAEDRFREMFASNCDGGCAVVDLLVVGPDGVNQETRNAP